MKLSSPEDRTRFHAIRSQARALIVGGNTFREEFYEQTPIPVYVASRTPRFQWIDRPMEKENPKAQFFSTTIPEILLRAERECGSPILIEAGASFIAPLLKEGLIDRLYLTRTDRKGDDHFYPLEEDLGRYHRVNADVVGDECFEIWELIPQK